MEQNIVFDKDNFMLGPDRSFASSELKSDSQ